MLDVGLPKPPGCGIVWQVLWMAERYYGKLTTMGVLRWVYYGEFITGVYYGGFMIT